MLTETRKKALYQGAPYTITTQSARYVMIAIHETQRMRNFDEPRAVSLVRWDGTHVPMWSDVAEWMDVDTAVDTLALAWLKIPDSYGKILDRGTMDSDYTPSSEVLETATGGWLLGYVAHGPLYLDTDIKIAMTGEHGETRYVSAFDVTD